MKQIKKVIKKLFGSIENRYQNNLELMRGSEFVFDYVHFLIIHKIDFNVVDHI